MPQRLRERAAVGAAQLELTEWLRAAVRDELALDPAEVCPVAEPHYLSAAAALRVVENAAS